MATKALLTVEDFMRLPDSVDGNDVRYELVEGDLITMSPGMLPHNLIRDTILTILRVFVTQRESGVVVSEQAFQISERTVRVPDVAFVRGKVTPDPDLIEHWESEIRAFERTIQRLLRRFRPNW